MDFALFAASCSGYHRSLLYKTRTVGRMVGLRLLRFEWVAVLLSCYGSVFSFSIQIHPIPGKQSLASVVVEFSNSGIT